MKILYFEDTPYWQNLYRQAFEKAGVEIKILPNANGDIVKEVSGFKPDLILSDICMPGRNGFEAVEILKGSKTTKNIPVFFFSSLSKPKHIQKGLSLGAEKYLVKTDYDSREIVKICLEFISERV